MRALAIVATVLSALTVTPAGARTDSRYSRQRGEGICHAAVDAIVPAGSTNRWLHRKVDVESGDDPGAWHRNRNGSIDRGCLQVNSIHRFSAACLFDARCNIRKALVVLRRQGRGAWTSPA